MQCMDGHYYVLQDNPACPLDGSTLRGEEQVLACVQAGAERAISLVALREAGVPQEVLARVLVVEVPDTAPQPFLLRPWYEGHAEAL